jgi:hypothetical protein
MKQLFLLFALLPFFATSQIIKDNNTEIDTYKMEINKNIFRVLLSASTDTKYAIIGNYEREINKPFTFFLKAGPTYSGDYLNTDTIGTTTYHWFLNAFASFELRYYYNLKRRARNQRTVRNYSAFYLSIEEQLVSKPILIFNKSGNEVLEEKNRQFINIGYQYQKIRTYYNLYFGTRFPGPIYNDISSGIDLLHAGVMIGRVF